MTARKTRPDPLDAHTSLTCQVCRRNVKIPHCTVSMDARRVFHFLPRHGERIELRFTPPHLEELWQAGSANLADCMHVLKMSDGDEILACGTCRPKVEAAMATAAHEMALTP